MNDAALLNRVKSYESRLGRKLRVLHIGNIANNAYINSKLLTECGVESHVLCYDYYHVMGAAEWEDAFFDTNKINHFNPDWRKIDLGHFQRPHWFVQGPLDLCLQYLNALQTRDVGGTEYLFRRLAAINRTKTPFSLRVSIRGLINRISTLGQLLLKLCGNSSVKDEFFSHFQDRKIHYSAETWAEILAELPVYVIALFLKRTKLSVLIRPLTEVSSRDALISFEQREFLKSEFRREFPNRIDQLTDQDFEILARYTPALRTTLEYYDVVHAYATDPMIPMLCGKSSYVAYEHGTIRSYVYNDLAVSRFAALAYRRAPAIVATNADCLPSAKFLRGPNSTVVCGLHGFDERQVTKRLQFTNQTRTSKQARFNIPEDVCVFLQPARQDWSIKGNDRVLEAIRILKSKRTELERPFVVVLTEWGNDVVRAKKFISEHQLDDDVHWIDILSKGNLVHSVAFVDAIVDQFLIPCIGAVPAELLTVSRGPLITFLDDNVMRDFYGRTLPVLNAQSPEEIATQMKKVINSHPDVQRSVKESKSWVREIHSHDKVISKCFDAYDQALRLNSSDGQK